MADHIEIEEVFEEITEGCQPIHPIRRKKRCERLRRKRKIAEAGLESEIMVIDVSSGEETLSMELTVANDTPGTSHGSEDPAKMVGDPTNDDLRHKLNRRAEVISKYDMNTKTICGDGEVAADESEETIDGDLWNKVARKAKELAQEEYDSDEKSSSGVSCETREEQRELWLMKWPMVHPGVLETLVDNKPRFSTLDVHTSISMRLATAGPMIPKMDQNLQRLLFNVGQIHMDVARYIERCNPDKPKYVENHAEPAPDELVMETSNEDRALLGLKLLPTNEPEEEEGKQSNMHYNPFNPVDNAKILWIRSKATRLKAWILDWPRSLDEAVENFVHERDVLKSVDSHAFICLKAMKLRDLVRGKEIKDLILRLALGHLKIIDYYHTHYHSVLKNYTNQKIPKRGHLW